MSCYLSQNLRTVRNVYQITQEEMAQLCDIPLSKYQAYEQGSALPDVAEAIKMAHRLYFTLQDLAANELKQMGTVLGVAGKPQYLSKPALLVYTLHALRTTGKYVYVNMEDIFNTHIKHNRGEALS